MRIICQPHRPLCSASHIGANMDKINDMFAEARLLLQEWVAWLLCLLSVLAIAFWPSQVRTTPWALFTLRMNTMTPNQWRMRLSPRLTLWWCLFLPPNVPDYSLPINRKWRSLRRSFVFWPTCSYTMTIEAPTFSDKTFWIIYIAVLYLLTTASSLCQAAGYWIAYSTTTKLDSLDREHKLAKWSRRIWDSRILRLHSFVSRCRVRNSWDIVNFSSSSSLYRSSSNILRFALRCTVPVQHKGMF